MAVGVCTYRDKCSVSGGNEKKVEGKSGAGGEAQKNTVTKGKTEELNGWHNTLTLYWDVAKETQAGT